MDPVCKYHIHFASRRQKKQNPVLQVDGPSNLGRLRLFFKFSFFFSGGKIDPKDMKILRKRMIFLQKNIQNFFENFQPKFLDFEKTKQNKKKKHQLILISQNGKSGSVRPIKLFFFVTLPINYNA